MDEIVIIVSLTDGSSIIPILELWDGSRTQASRSQVPSDNPPLFRAEQPQQGLYFISIFFKIMQDTADGEFAVVKTALNSHLLRSNSSADDYSENLSSKQIADFGNAHLGTPNASSDMSLRVFRDLLPTTVMSRKEQDKQDPADGKTLSGISSVFEIICQVKQKKITWSHIFSFFT